MKKLFLFLTTFSVVAVRAAWWSGDLLVINEDNDHYFKLPSEQMTESALRAYVDSYARTKVTHLFFCATGQRASYRSSVHDAIWDEIDGKAPKIGNRWAENAKLLWSRGIDPYAVWIDQCRKRNISPWISQRMNDCHHADRLSTGRNSNFWRSHPELWRVPSSKGRNWNDRALDYSKAPVFSYALGIAKELLERYDMDGLELDWMRNPWCLTPGKEKEQAHVLTQFLREVRRLAQIQEQRRGHPVRLAVRLPTHPIAAQNLGFDFPAWARQGLIDLISATAFYGTVDTACQIDLWHEALGTETDRVALLFGIDETVSSANGFRGVSVSPEMIRGWANGLAGQGERNFYFFNYPYLRDGSGARAISPDARQAYQELLQNGPLGAGSRCWILGRRDVTGGVPYSCQLPWVTEKAKTFTFFIGEPPSGTINATIGLSKKDACYASAGFRAELNGIPSAASPSLPSGVLTGGPDIGQNIVFSFPASSVKKGKNQLTVTPPKGISARVGWIELSDPVGCISRP